MLETRRRSRQRGDRLRFRPRIRRYNDHGRIRKASGGRPKALYGMPEVQRDLTVGRTPTSSRLQAFRIPSLKGSTSRGDSGAILVTESVSLRVLMKYWLRSSNCKGRYTSSRRVWCWKSHCVCGNWKGRFAGPRLWPDLWLGNFYDTNWNHLPAFAPHAGPTDGDEVEVVIRNFEFQQP